MVLLPSLTFDRITPVFVAFVWDALEVFCDNNFLQSGVLTPSFLVSLGTSVTMLLAAVFVMSWPSLPCPLAVQIRRSKVL